jgi:DNA-binding transcriptional ArsR family regulator
MYPELLTYARVVEAEFHLSLPQDLITSIRLLQAVDAFEGLSEWVYQTAATLPDAFRSELTLLGYPIKWCFRRQDSLLWRLSPENPAHARWEDFRAYLAKTPPEEFQRVLLLNLAEEAGRPEPPGDLTIAAVDHMLAAVQRIEQEKWEQAFVDLWDDAPLVQLIWEPKQLKARLIALFTDFWEQYYREDFERHREAIARSVEYHRGQAYPRSFAELFRRVTGRALSARTQEYVQQHLDRIERVIFNPCAHLGLYFQITLSYPTLIVAFNYRTALSQEAEGRTAIELFPPLKALGDETRLHILSLLGGGEMYAQEIVDAIGLSQSTVSRHLQLLQRTEILTARHSRGMKFYSINRERSRAIIAALKLLIG